MQGKLIRGLSIYKYHKEFHIRWLLGRLEIYLGAYYNYHKNRKAGYCAKKAEVHRQVAEIYHKHNGIDGYCGIMMRLVSCIQKVWMILPGIVITVSKTAKHLQ